MSDNSRQNSEETNQFESILEHYQQQSAEELIALMRHDIIAGAGSIETTAAFLRMLITNDVEIRENSRITKTDLYEVLDTINRSADDLILRIRAASRILEERNTAEGDHDE